MADLLISYFAGEILQMVQSIVTDAVTRAWGLEDDLKKLSESTGRLQSLLQKAQNVLVVEDDEGVKLWLLKLQDVVYAAADVLDEFQYEILRCKVEVKNQLKRKVRHFVSRNNPILFRVNMAAQVKEVSESLADMEKQAPLVLLTITIPAMSVAAERGVVLNNKLDRRTDSFLGESERPIGRTEEAERIIEMLQVSSSDVPRLSVISIVGFGGLGKTTFTQLVLEKAKKKGLFDEIMWVCVSEPFDTQKILGEMLQKLDKTTGALSSIDVIVGNLQMQLKDKRFLLVLDDVWNTESEKWDNLKRRLGNICAKCGNFVIVTTRSRNVANVMETQHMLELNQLSDVECWSIIKERVLTGNEGESIIPHDMETIGIEIAKKCGGVPLVAKVVGGVLRSCKKKAEWLSLQRSNVWDEVDNGKRIFSVLKLSFDHLPSPQKLCFAYCSLFPKDVVFDKAQLIQLWMAEDFLKTTLTNGGKSARLMEDVGEEYFHSLLNNSFFQDAVVDECGNIIQCKMHDLLHDLALSISKSQRLECGSNCMETSYGRCLNCSCDRDSTVQEILEKSKNKTTKLRSLFCRVDISPMLSNFRRLRTLDMSDAKLKNLPNAIRKLKHLKYLDISKNETIQELPESITKLYNLQTLRVFGCKSLKELPRKIINLVNLRHIYFNDKRLMPLGVGYLSNLHTLPFFFVGLQKGQTIDELEGLKDLRGELVICNLENVRCKEEAERAKIKEKKLSKLELQWMKVQKYEEEKFSSSKEASYEEVMEGLEAPTNIQSLTVEWYMGKQFPQWMSELSDIVKLTLRNCKRCATMPTLGRLPYLKLLRVERIKPMGSEFYGESSYKDTTFSLLQEFSIRKMKNLEEWVTPKGTEIFPKLRKLYIQQCPNLTSFPLSQLPSSAIYTRRPRSGEVSMEILCSLNFKSLEDSWISDCPKLKFLNICLTNSKSFHLFPGHYSSRKQDEMVKNLSKELGGSLKFMNVVAADETIKEFPKSLEALQIEHFHDTKLSLEALRRLSCLRRLEITFCDGIESIPTLSSLTSLNHLQISFCSRLESIPSLSSLTSLKHLQIAYCDRLESIPTLSSLTSLNHLHISGRDRLKSIPSISSLTSLQYLAINCSGLELIPVLPSLTSLKHLHINCPAVNSIPTISTFSSLEILSFGFRSNWPLHIFSTLTCLKELHISRCHNLSELILNSLSTLTCLEKLSIRNCDELKSLPSEIKQCTSLKELTVGTCREMVRIDDDIIGSLTKLNKIWWGAFSEELDQVPGLNSVHLPTSLEKVTIKGWKKLTSLPHQLQHLTSIIQLEICDFDGVESLPDWLGNLSSLQILSIKSCKNLKNLPTGMQRLLQLRRFQIWRCPLIPERYAKDAGHEWSNISHIPYIDIQDPRSETNSEISV